MNINVYTYTHICMHIRVPACTYTYAYIGESIRPYDPTSTAPPIPIAVQLAPSVPRAYAGLDPSTFLTCISCFFSLSDETSGRPLAFLQTPLSHTCMHTCIYICMHTLTQRSADRNHPPQPSSRALLDHHTYIHTYILTWPPHIHTFVHSPDRHHVPQVSVSIRSGRPRIHGAGS